MRFPTAVAAGEAKVAHTKAGCLCTSTSNRASSPDQRKRRRRSSVIDRPGTFFVVEVARLEGIAADERKLPKAESLQCSMSRQCRFTREPDQLPVRGPSSSTPKRGHSPHRKAEWVDRRGWRSCITESPIISTYVTAHRRASRREARPVQSPQAEVTTAVGVRGDLQSRYRSGRCCPTRHRPRLLESQPPKARTSAEIA